MKDRKRVIYKGEIYHLQTLGRYYQRRYASPGNPERTLHRVIWTEHHGKIPKGMCIHHRDGNWRNNDISNLELWNLRLHAAFHLRERWKSPAFRARQMARLPATIKNLIRWKNSSEGRAWQSRQAKINWSKRKPWKRKCGVCNKKFLAMWPNAKFCSRKCANNFFNEGYYDKPSKCLICGKKFMAKRYSHGLYCQKICATTAMWRIRRGEMKNPI